MVLTDHQIAVQAGNGLLEHYDPSCITNIGYDLRAEYFVSENKKVSRISLKHGESAFVATQENICLPDNMLGRIVLKNSRLRQGLSMDAPVYQPGHHTKVFFRVTNVSGNEIDLQKDGKYVTILFEMLASQRPPMPVRFQMRWITPAWESIKIFTSMRSERLKRKKKI